MKKRILSMMIAIVMVIGLVPIGAITVSAADADVWDGTTAATAFDSGTGTEDNPYVIMTAEQLAKLASDVNGGTYYTDTYFKLGANIDLGGDTYNWTPIGGYHTNGQTAATAKNNTFAGVLDGNGKTISNMSSTTEASAYAYNGYRALFGNLSGTVMNLTLDSPKVSAAYQYVAGLVAYSNGGTIKNITVNAPSIESTEFGSTRYGVSAIVGYLTNGSTVENCHVNGGTISAINPGVGAVAGYLDGTSIKNCSATNVAITYTSSPTRVGSVVGAVVNADVTDCHATGCSITGTHAATSGYGGIVGYVQDATVSDCTVKNANLSVAAENVGGIVGHLEYVDGTNVVKNCFVEGSTITCTSAPVAGVVGYSFGNSASVNTIKNCGVTGGSVTGEYNVGGIVGNAYQTNVIGCYNHGMDVVANGSFSSVSAGGISGYNGKIYSCFSSTTVSLPNSTSTRFGPIGGDYSTANFCAYDSTVYNSTSGYTYMGEGYTEEQVRSGEVTYYLSTQGTSNSNSFTDWKQTIGTQDYPSLVGKTVFYDAAKTPQYYNNVTYTVTLPTATAEGSVSASTVDAAEGETVTLTVTPATNYELSSISVTAEDNTPVIVIDNKFTMPASNVIVAVEFAFKKASASIMVNGLNTTYNGSAQPVSLELPTDLDEQYVAVIYKENGYHLMGAPINAGEYEVIVSIKNSPNYEDAEFEYDMKINPIELDFLWVSVVTPTDGFVFNGKAHEPDVRLYIDGTYTPIEEVGGCTVTYENNTNAGNATVKITGNYEATAGFIIKKATPVVDLGAPVTKVLPGYIMNVAPTSNALDKLGDPSYALTILDGEGYSVNGNVITIDEGLAIGTTITVKVEYAETTNYVGIISDHQLEVGVPSVDTTELEKKIEALKVLIDSNTASILQINAAIADINSELALLDDKFVTHDELTKALAGINDAIKKLNDKTVSIVATNANDITNLKTSVDGIKDAISALAGEDRRLAALIQTLDAELDNLSISLDALKTRVDKAENNIEALKSELATKYAELYALIYSNTNDIASINNTLQSINSIIATLASQTDVEAEVDALNSLIEALTDRIEANEEDITANNGEISKLQSTLTALSNTVASNSAALAQNISTLSSVLTVLETRVEQNEQDIYSLRNDLNKTILELKTLIEEGDKANAEALANAIIELKDLIEEAKKVAKDADEALKADLEGLIASSVKTLNESITLVQKNLDIAKNELNTSIENLDVHLSTRIDILNRSLNSAIAAYKMADEILKAELIVKIDEAYATLEAAIKAIEKKLDTKVTELNTAITNGNADLEGKIKELSDALKAAKTALESADSVNKTELSAKIDEAYSSLEAAIKAVQKNLDEAKASLEAKDKELALKDSELEAKANDLESFVIVVCVISCVTLAGLIALVIWYVVDKNKKK